MIENSSLAPQSVLKRKPFDFDRSLNTFAAWFLALLWLLPLLYAVWTAFHPSEYETRFSLFAPLTLQNFVQAWNEAPFARYFLNTVILSFTKFIMTSSGTRFPASMISFACFPSAVSFAIASLNISPVEI